MQERLSYRQMRVFVSSTFQDMVAERNVLVSRVFPRLREYCRRRRIEFIGVDLRWGITDEQSLAGKTVNICMKEIDRCRPLFLAMLGERYGWVPEEASISVTEQEIRYGALEAPADTEAFFYFRDPSLTESLCGAFTPDERLTDLKQRIRADRYPVLDGYADLNTFEERVYADLTGAVDRLAEELGQLDAAEETRQEQWYLAAHYAVDFTGRRKELRLLDEETEKGGLVLLTGEPGVGKRTLLSAWALRQREKEPYPFLFYADSLRGGWEYPARQLAQELKRRFLPDYPIPEDAEGLRRAVSVLLNLVSKRGGRVLIMLDRADLLLRKDGYGFSWLPREMPQGVCAVLSVNDGEALEILRRRAHREVRLQRFTPEEIGQVTEEYLSFWSKSLSPANIKLLSEAEPARHPLYLTTLLNEVRQRGRHETLTQELTDCLNCGTLAQLLDRILARLEKEYEEGLAERLLLLLEAAPDGLTEIELLGLLGDIPQALFAPLRLELEPFTAMRMGALYPQMPAFRKAVRDRYTVTEETLREYRNQLIAWFTAHTEAPRRALVLPRLLRMNTETEQLYALLREPACFLTQWRRSREQTKELWRWLGEQGREAAQGYKDITEAPEGAEPDLLAALALFFTETGGVGQAEKLLVCMLREEQPAQTRMLAAGLAGNRAQQAGRLQEAEGMYRLRYRLAGEAGDRYEQQRALGNIGLIRQRMGDNRAAREAFETVFSLAEKLNQTDAMQTALGNLGNIAFSLGETAEAERLFLRQKALCGDSGNTVGQINASGALGILYCRRGDFEAAEREFEEQYRESMRISAADGLSNALGNRANMEALRGRMREAEELFREKLALCRETGQFLGEQNALANLSRLTSRRGDGALALRYARERAELTGRNRAFRQYAQALLALAEEEQRAGQAEQAHTHRLQADAIARQHGYYELIQSQKGE